MAYSEGARPVRRVEERRGDLGHAATSRFLSPLSEPDMRLRIWLSAKTSGLRTREVMGTRLQLHEPQRAVEVLVREASRPRVADLVLVA